MGGHDHLLQHLVADGTDFYIVGAGGGELEDRPYEFPTNASVLHTAPGAFGFGVLEIGSENVCMSFHVVNNDYVGNVTYRHCRPHSEQRHSLPFGSLQRFIAQASLRRPAADAEHPPWSPPAPAA